ncbi:MAG: adenosylmethionine--8-amino-7-oxononanoate transaminase [Deltaproteobacteria bacterium]|nr:adenosylmethionine--8-amino-7-oxononanoate transaminase [Deltaproteobacteria bacterium]
MSAERVHALEEADRRHMWKPFTQMAGYVAGTPLVIGDARGNWLRDVRGRVFLDGVSSLWVNLHGHNHPTIVAALKEQLDTLDHATLLGPTNVPATMLAARLVQIAPGDHLTRVFYSDSGSTSVEIAVKMAYQYFAQHRDASQRTRNVFISMTNAYHGDTLGSVSVGGIDLFHQVYAPLLFETVKAPGPDPYHRAFGQSVAEHEEECLTALKERFASHHGRVAALVMEPLMQGAAGMIAHTPDFLRRAAAVARGAGSLLILDEVATGFGRTGTMFACEQADVVPDLLCLAKGITGGTLPLAATLASEEVYSGFLGEHSEYRTFFHGHSYTGNPLACIAALASLKVFRQENVLEHVQARIAQLAARLEVIAAHPHVGDIRRHGLMTGIELVRDKATGDAFDSTLRMGNRVIERALEHGVLIRPLGDVVVLMPTLSVTEDELDLLTGVTLQCIDEVVGELA